MAEGTMIDMGDGFGGMSLLSGGAGFVGGLVLGSLWNGNGPWGGRGNAAAGYDTGAINAIQGQLSALQGQVSNADRDLLLQTSNQNQFTGNLINSTADAILTRLILLTSQTSRRRMRRMCRTFRPGPRLIWLCSRASAASPTR